MTDIECASQEIKNSCRWTDQVAAFALACRKWELASVLERPGEHGKAIIGTGVSLRDYRQGGFTFAECYIISGNSLVQILKFTTQDGKIDFMLLS